MRLRALLPIVALTIAAGLVMQPVGCNQTAHYALVKSLAERSATIDRYRFQSCDTAYVDGHTYAAKAPGLALFTEPFYWVLRKVGAADDFKTVVDRWPDGMLAVPRAAIWRVGLFGVLLPFLGLLLLIRWTVERLVPGRGTITAVAVGAGTILLPFSTLYFSHMLSATLAFASFAVALAERSRTRGSPALLAAVGLLAGLAITAEFPLAVSVALVLLYAVLRRPLERAAIAARAGLVAVGAAVGLAPLLAFNTWAFGSPFHISYANAVIDPGTSGHDVLGANATGFFGLTRPRLHDAIELLASGRGLLTLAPLLAVSVPGLVLLARRGRRAEAALIAAIGIVLLVYVSAYYVPFGGWVPGPRFLIPLLPFLALPVAAALDVAPLAVAALAIVSALTMILATMAEPLLPTDHTTLWLHRLVRGDFTHTVVTALGGGHGWGAILPVLALVLAAIVGAIRLIGPLTVRRIDIERATAAILAWLVVLGSTPELLRADRAYGGSMGVVAAIAVLLALAAATALVWRLGAKAIASALPLAGFAWPNLASHRLVSLAVALGALGLTAALASTQARARASLT
jgi:hypothetical protein